MYLCVRFALHFNFVSVISEYYGVLCFADSEYVSESERKYGESFSNFSHFLFLLRTSCYYHKDIFISLFRNELAVNFPIGASLAFIAHATTNVVLVWVMQVCVWLAIFIIILLVLLLSSFSCPLPVLLLLYSFQ